MCSIEVVAVTKSRQSCNQNSSLKICDCDFAAAKNSMHRSSEVPIVIEPNKVVVVAVAVVAAVAAVVVLVT